MQGRNVLAKDYAKRDAVFAARDRCDETVERIRSVRTDRFKYIRNYLPERPHLQPNAYKDGKAIVQRLRELHAAASSTTCKRRCCSPRRGRRRNCTTSTADPHEVNNLAADPKHTDHAGRDCGSSSPTGRSGPATAAARRSRGDVRLGHGGLPRPAAAKKGKNDELQRNIDQNRAWMKEGK